MNIAEGLSKILDDNTSKLIIADENFDTKISIGLENGKLITYTQYGLLEENHKGNELILFLRAYNELLNYCFENELSKKREVKVVE